MDFAIVIASNQPEQTFIKAGDIFNNIFLSLAIKQGSWWLNPNFGLRDRGRLKNTESTARLIREDCKRALQWLVDSGRAIAIEVTTERDRSSDLHRLKILVEATQADGRKVSFETFKEVV
jgi:phage gp46-like protein